ncbi:MAG: ParB/Srx family N-terminal domain-containing protein [candidate division Zixibacteria bacterium]|nr:ParB/Srx family N-terminal domain-containing protein [candidate division Zixibacteria bacterium]
MVAKAEGLKDIEIVDLLLDAENPRFPKQQGQRVALQKMVDEQGPRLAKLAEHIGSNGLNPTEVPIVIRKGSGDEFIVLEGNRRIAAIKLGTEPKLVDSLELPSSTAKRYKAINGKRGSKLPQVVKCYVAESRATANPWIELRHTGRNKGVGIIPWTGMATSRFRGEEPEIQMIEGVKDSHLLHDETLDRLEKMAVTNLQRLLKTPEARRTLGIDVVKGQLIFLSGDSSATMGRLAIVVSDIAHRHIKVTQLDSKDQRIDYANAVAARKLPQAGKKITPTDITKQFPPTKVKRKSKVNAARNRKTLVPKSLKLSIGHKRIARIFDEMKRLPLTKDFENSGSVLLRVFLEMSLEEFRRANSIPWKDTKKSPPRELTLRQKVKRVADFLEKKGTCGRNELHGIRTLANTKGEVFSIDTWHAYVHNPDYNPSSDNLMRDWDNVQPFFENIWA